MLDDFLRPKLSYKISPRQNENGLFTPLQSPFGRFMLRYRDIEELAAERSLKITEKNASLLIYQLALAA